LYVIVAYEQVIRAQVDLSQVPVMTTPPTPVLPPIANLMVVYKALKEDDLIDSLSDLVMHPALP
jgi:predicted transcriptional regulator